MFCVDSRDDGLAFTALMLLSPRVCVCVRRWGAGRGGCTEGLMEEGVSSGQQEPCLFPSAPLDFKSVPAELTASSRFAWGAW